MRAHPISLPLIRTLTLTLTPTLPWPLTQVDLISLSVGGPDYRDAPFVAKVR
jgi:hypothetical protein